MINSAMQTMVEEVCSRTEGETAIDQLNKLAEKLGYKEDGFKYGSSFERLLQDNSFLVEAIHNAIMQEGENNADWVTSAESFCYEEGIDFEGYMPDDGMMAVQLDGIQWDATVKANSSVFC